MILAEKITEERKKLAMSQEELAEKLSVSRQAVSKWESAQSIPDIQKIIAMSELFSVSTDYLLKDDALHEISTIGSTEAVSSVRRVSMEEANSFLDAVAQQSRTVAIGVVLCVLCPVLLIFLSGLSREKIAGISEATACAVGLAALFIMVAVAVYLFIKNGADTKRFDYLEKEEIETAYGVTGFVKEKKSNFEPVYTRVLTTGIILCVLSPLPLIICSIIKESEVLSVSMTALLLCIVALGVYLIIRVGTVMNGYKILLQEEEYRKSEKKSNRAVGAASGIYWSLATAVYLAWSFITMDWKSTWIVWPIAGVLCAPVMMIVRHCTREKHK